MRVLYRLLWWLALPLAWVLLRRAGGADGRWHERRGRPVPIADGVEVWVHAASFGEVQAASPLIDALLRRHGDGRIGVTTMTATGSALVRQRWATRVHHAYLPFDLPGFVGAFLDRWRPRQVIVLESELWPSLFAALRVRGIPLKIANARMSARSRRRYARLGGLMRQTIACVDAVAAQSVEDAESYRAFGAAHVAVTGNLKFDCVVPAAQVQEGTRLRAMLGAQRPVWIAASTHDGEEQAALAAHQALCAALPDAALILVPRHPQRFDAVWAQVRASGLHAARRSAGSVDAQTQVLLGDTMGEMFAFLAAADVAFVGGSLAPIGGHNLLEPAALGRPVLFGPHMHAQRPARTLLLDAGGAREVADAQALGATVLALLRAPEQAQRIGAAAHAALSAHQGATARVLQLFDGAAGSLH